ncbi:MAG: hypothetical protein RPU42_11205 [Candidatus Sedimenticola sp. (ex Thyasira tokunagai)]
MAYTQTDLDAIDAAIASGELEVAYSDRRVRYRSISELKTARAIIQKELATGAGNRPTRQYRMKVSKGI